MNRRSIALVLACFVGPLAVLAVAADDVMTMEHIAKLRNVTAAEISPDGEWIAYTLGVPREPFEEDSGGAWVELHVVDRQGNSRPYVTGKVNVSGVQWTPDGESISFLAKRDGDEHRALYSIPLRGGESSRILSHETAIGSYAWDPSGARVAVLADDKEPDGREKLEKKGFNAEVVEEQPKFTRLWIGAVGEKAKDDEAAKPRRIELAGNASELHFHPDGRHVVLALAPTPFVDDEYMKRAVHVVDVETGAVVHAFPNNGKMGQISISPDGSHIAMIGAEDQHDPGEGRLVVASTFEGNFTDILPGLLGHVTAIAWNNPNRITFLCDQGTTTSVEMVNFDGTERVALVPAGTQPFAGLSMAANGRSGAGISDTAKHPAEVFAFSGRMDAPTRLTNSNPWLDELRFAPQEVVKHTARDGLELEGVLIRPLDEVAGTRYPLILVVHGGPEAHMSNGWQTRYSQPGQVAAAQGYAVFHPNYRGSTGRGVEFSKLSQADYGGKEFDDLVDAVDHLVEIGLVDKDKVGVTGGSYGGYATAWCSTKLTERFAAGVMFVGISNHISKSGTTDIPNEMYLVHGRKWLTDDWQWFLERSPVYYVKQAKTPLLIMHGKNDPRVHPEQSLELYRQLKNLGQTPVRLVYYPGEGHGNRNSAARYDYSLRLMQWFDHYLKGPGGDPPPSELDYPLQPKDKDDKEEKPTDPEG